MTLPTPVIITAAITRYRNDATLQGLLGSPTHASKSVFDEDGAPVNYPFPYIVCSIPTEQTGTALVMGMDGVDSYLQVGVFTQTGASGGFAQARGIATQVYNLMFSGGRPVPFDLSASGLNQFFCLFQDQRPVPQPDGITQMIAQRYKLMTQG